MRLFRLIAAVAALGAVTPAVAQEPAYKTDDVVEFFSNQPDADASRGICIGTAEECGLETRAAQTRSGFDLTVDFEFGSAALTDGAKRNLDAFAQALKDDRLQRAQFVLEGHTDAVGTDEDNARLSEDRARAVAVYLVRQGVEESKLTSVGFGEQRPIAADPYDAANRRVEARMVLR